MRVVVIATADRALGADGKSVTFSAMLLYADGATALMPTTR